MVFKRLDLRKVYYSLRAPTHAHHYRNPSPHCRRIGLGTRERVKKRRREVASGGKEEKRRRGDSDVGVSGSSENEWMVKGMDKER
jgi:hypothetical protein